MLALRQSIRASGSARVMARSYSQAKDADYFSGGEKSDAFTERGKSNEDYYVRQHEAESLKKLRSEIEKREKDLKDLKDQEKNFSK